MAGGISKEEIKKIWGIAKSPELRLTDEELHALVLGHTGKDSIRALGKREATTVIRTLTSMRNSVMESSSRDRKKKTAGTSSTENQRKKIYKLCEELGWDKPSRVNGLCKKMFGVSSVKWLDYRQCSKLIEALKAILEREARKNE